MIELEIIDTLTPIICLVAGIVGFLYAGERVIGSIPLLSGLVDTEDKGTAFIKILSVILTVVVYGWVILLFIVENNEFHWITVFLLALYGIVVMAHPIKNLEGWAIFLMLIPIALISITIFWFAGDREWTFLGMNISLWLVLLLVTIVLLIIFVLIFIWEETMIDPMLSIIGWAPVIVVVGLVMILHGIMLILDPPAGLASLSIDTFGET
ncbi:MAG: hypothetical protein ACXAC7_11735 [Candidatus Hodarchaeales archaeon]|jgi:hypothetical protein